MPRRLVTLDIPLLGRGENTATGLGSGNPAENYRLENGIIIGPGLVAQTGDWIETDTMTDGATADESVVGPWPFATDGDTGGESGGVAISHDGATDLRLQHLDEDGAVLRRVDITTSWGQNRPPQVTGFEMYARFYFAADGREAAASRLGLRYYNPASGGSITTVSADVGGGSAVLRFKGISKHRGGTILGWGYGDNTTADRPEMVRYCKYTDPDTWVPSSADGEITAGSFLLGTPGLPVVAAAESGNYSVIGKRDEVFALGGDYSSQFYLSQIGSAHGPVSGTGMVSITGAAVWMSEQGPAISWNGGRVQLLGTDRLFRRLATYHDLSYAWAVHHRSGNRVGWLLKRSRDLDGVPQSHDWADQILWWDYERDVFYVERTPTSVFSIGTIQGDGLSAGGPAGAPSSASVSGTTSSTTTLSWSNGDASPGTTTQLRIRVNGESEYTTVSSSIGAGVTSYPLTGLEPSTTYDVELTHYKNGQASSAYEETSLFTTSAASTVGTPSNFNATLTDSGSDHGGAYNDYSLTWTRGEFASGSKFQLLMATTNSFAAAVVQIEEDSAITSSGTRVYTSETEYWWVRHKLADGTLGTEVALTQNPLTGL